MNADRPRTVARRLASVPLAAVLTAVALAVFLLALLTSPVTLLFGPRLRLLRFSAFLLLYLLADLAGLLAACSIWIRCTTLRGPERDARLQTLSYALLARLLTLLRSAAGSVFGLRVAVDPPIPGPGRTGPAPLLVFARHAGPGDSFLLLHGLLCDAGLRPQVVLKRFLRWDPCLDVLISRTPHYFVPAYGGPAAAEAIGALGAAVGPGQAVVIFPEGGNFTERRRTRAIAWLRRNGEYRRAARAQRQHHVLPPRMPGAPALLAGAGDGGADLVFIAHTGLDRLDSLARIWHGVPLRMPLSVGWWRVPGSQVPANPAAVEDWLTDQWSRVDSWIRSEIDGPSDGDRTVDAG